MIGYEVKDDLRLVKVKRLLGLPIYEKKRTDSRLERSFLVSGERSLCRLR